MSNHGDKQDPFIEKLLLLKKTQNILAPSIFHRHIYDAASLKSFPMGKQSPGPVSIFDNTSYRKISWSLEAARLVV